MKMKGLKSLTVILAMGGMAVFSSCGTPKAALTLADIDGEWNITEAGGKAIETGTNGKIPFIGFNISEGRIYGNAGCNMFTDALNKDLKPGRLDLSRMGSTKMMCPDMTVEDLIMTQMMRTESYKKLNNGKIALCDAEGNKVIILERKGK